MNGKILFLPLFVFLCLNPSQVSASMPSMVFREIIEGFGTKAAKESSKKTASGLAKPAVRRTEPVFCTATKNHGRSLLQRNEITSPELLDVVEKHGDRAADFIWRNKAALTTTAVLATFVADPEPFLRGTASLADIATNNIATGIVGPIGEKIALTAKRPVALVVGVVVAIVFARIGLAAFRLLRNRPILNSHQPLERRKEKR